MSTATKIEWTEVTWNPTTGCDRISPGCDNCYALRLAKRLKGMGQAKYQHDGDPRTSGPGFGVTVHEDALEEPLRWRKPRKVFVNSMSDIGHARVPALAVARVFAVMALSPEHSFQVLPKRPGRLASMLGKDEFRNGLVRPVIEALLLGRPALAGRFAGRADPFAWPVPNVWVGTSIESDEYCWRADQLRRIPAAIRFLSLEPLLGPLPGGGGGGGGWERERAGFPAPGPGLGPGPAGPVCWPAGAAVLQAVWRRDQQGGRAPAGRPDMG